MIQQLKNNLLSISYKTYSKGEAPIYCKITLNDKKQPFSTGIYLSPEQWDKESQRARGITDEALLLNRKIQEINSQLVKLENQL